MKKEKTKKEEGCPVCGIAYSPVLGKQFHKMGCKLEKEQEEKERLRKEKARVPTEKVDEFIRKMEDIDSQIEAEEQKLLEATERFQESWLKEHNIDALENQKKLLEKELNIRQKDLVECEKCKRLYHKSQIKKWVWTGGDMGDGETIRNCPEGHQI